MSAPPPPQPPVHSPASPAKATASDVPDGLALAPVEDAIAAIAAGRMVILVDDEDRENEGDLVAAADLVTAEQINFMARHGRGLICLALSSERCDALGLAPMVDHNTAPLQTAFTRTIDHRDHGGVAASARAKTIRLAVDPASQADDFVTPGHVFPLRARPGGVLVRSGQTEGSVDLARLAGRASAGVICEVMGEDGTMMRLPKLLAFAREHDLLVTSVAAMIRYRLTHERLVRCVSQAKLPTEYGEFDVRCYEDTVNGQVHVALIYGEVGADNPKGTLVRVHRSDAVADVFGLDFMPSRSNLAWSLRRMAATGSGVLLYLRPDGDGGPLDGHLRLYGAIARGEPVGPSGSTMGFHDFGVGAQILSDLGLTKIRVVTNRPRAFKGLSGHGLEIVSWVPLKGDPEAPDETA